MLDAQSPEINSRKISIPAVLTAVFGTLTLTAFFFGPGMLLLALVALLFAIIAWRQNVKEPGVWVGNRLVWWGIAVFVFSISGVIAHEVTVRHSIENSARLVAEQWLKYFQSGNSEAVYELTRPGARHFNAEKLHDALSKDPEAQIAYDNYMKQEAIAPLITSGKKLSWEYVTSNCEGAGEPRTIANIYFQLTVHDKDQPRTIPYRISVERSVGNASVPQWRIGSTKIESPSHADQHPE